MRLETLIEENYDKLNENDRNMELYSAAQEGV